MTRARIWQEVKPFLGLAIVVVVYAITRAVFGALADGRGLLTPSGSLDTTLAILGAATLALRAAVLVVVPFIAVYRLVMRLARSWIA